ncbi:MAG TPA: ATP-binding protein [Flavisolibacter sp.]|nr:ATP-binding protein [Flavisolibacter sp.]
MQELAKVTLENEMDLILAHKRSMKLAELAGLSLSAQTTFATAVSEVSRTTIESGKSGCLILSVDTSQREKYLVARLENNHANLSRSQEGLEYAKKLVNRYTILQHDNGTAIELFFYIAPGFRIDIHKLDEWRSLFRNEPPLSPYEELKRKNEQLQELSERVQKSETQYKTLTNSLPLIIFSLNSEGQLIYANDWLTRYTGLNPEQLNRTGWKTVVHADDYDAFQMLLKSEVLKGTAAVKTQARLKHAPDGDYLWHQLSLTPALADKDQSPTWTGYLVDIHAQKLVEETLKDNQELKETQHQLKENQQTMERYIEELNRSNEELQTFAFVASHDLQEPVRKLLFYSDYLLKLYKDALDKKGSDVLQSMHAAAQRMRSLIQDLLLFSQINKEEIVLRPVDLNKIVGDVLNDLEMGIREKQARIDVQSLPQIQGDDRMIRQLFGNLISNSIKYSQEGTPLVITISSEQKGAAFELAFRDNGIGFDEKYLPQLFTLFQRLHPREKYKGTGLGLAICKKVADLHGGRIWAEATEGSGATFFVSLPAERVS